MTRVLKIFTANEITGGLSKPSKMPGYAYGLPAAECKVGSVLRQIPNSVCSKCYALKGRYVFPNVQAAEYRRLEALKDPQWIDAMVHLIQQRKIEWFRWHDSGDIQDLEHLEKIVEVARRCPDTKFWLPTREKKIVRSYKGAVPNNLVIRVSGAMIDGEEPKGFANTSTVVSAGETCPARNQGNECKDCRACWDRSVVSVSYRAH